MKIVSARQMRDIEAAAINKYGIPALLLMENAARGVAEHAAEAVKDVDTPRIFVAAGTGNNGGDGFAVARLLFARGMDVRVLVVGHEERMTPDARSNLDMVKALGIPVGVPDSLTLGASRPDQVAWNSNSATADEIETDLAEMIKSSDLVLDALLGTGLRNAPEGSYAEVIDVINRFARRVIAVDIPSGVCADTGHVSGRAVRAWLTVTFGFVKRGLLLYPGAEFAGAVVVENISIPVSVAEEAGVVSETLTDGEAAALLPVRLPRANKGTFGKAYVLAGCHEMPGAAVMAAHAAYRAGAGLVAVCAVEAVARVIQGTLHEAVTRILPDEDGQLCRAAYEEIAGELEHADVVAVGPGMGRSRQAGEFVAEAIRRAKAPLVLDADALFAVAAEPDVLRRLSVPCVITPHPGEMSRLTGHSIERILNDTVGEALAFAKEYGVVTLLKDARTVIAAPDGRFAINTSGNPAMAKAGSGDVLAGIITGLMAQGMDAYEAALLAAYAHGKAGDRAAKELSGYSVNATDLIQHLPQVLLGWKK